MWSKVECPRCDEHLDRYPAWITRIGTTAPCPYNPCCGCLTIMMMGEGLVILSCNECSEEAGRGSIREALAFASATLKGVSK